VNAARTMARPRAMAFAALVVLSLSAAACGTTPRESHGRSTSLTTLPNPVQVQGSGPGATYPQLGLVNRVLVSRVGRGALTPRLAKDGYLPLSAVEIGYRQFGSGPNLLLLSGQDGSMTSWDPRLLLALASHYRVTQFDYPGVGYSQPDSRYASIGSLADLTAGLIWSLGIAQPTVAGWGLGASIALSLVERHPGLVWRLVLAEATAGGKESIAPDTVTQSGMDSPFETTIEFSRLYFPPAADAQRLTWIDDIQDVIADSITAGAIRREADFVSASYRSNEISAQLPSVRIPVLLFAGADDLVVPPENSARIARSMPHASLVILRDAGYAGIFQDLTTFVNDVVAFTST
jgi:pimeloyl-ACP methyl ester carboxylesterase